jgi:hypothetical protein
VLELFRSGSFSSHLFLLVYTIAVYGRILVGMPSEADPESGTYLWMSMMGWKQELPYLFTIVQILVVFLAASQVAGLVNIHKLCPQNTLIPGVFFLLLSHLSLSLIGESQIQFALLFLILAARSLLLQDSNKVNPFSVFNIGFFLAISGLFYTSFFFLLPLFLIAYLILQPLSPRQFAQVLLGYLTPVFFQAVISISLGKEPLQGIISIWESMGFSARLPSWQWYYFILTSLYLLLILSVIFFRGKLYYKRNVMVKRKINVTYFLLFAGLISLLFQKTPKWESLVIITPFLSMLLSMWLASSKNKLLSELVHVVILGTLLFLHYFIGV